MVTPISYTSLQNIRSSLSNDITEYRDFAALGAPVSPLNYAVYLAKTSGGIFTQYKLYMYLSGVWYEADPPHGYIFDDGTNLYQIMYDGSVLELHPNIYSGPLDSDLDLNCNNIKNIDKLESCYDSITSAPIMIANYASVKLEQDVAVVPLLAGINVVSGFTAMNQPLIGNVAFNSFIAAQNGIYEIHYSCASAGAQRPRLEIYDVTSNRTLGCAEAIDNGRGCATNFCSYLTSGSVVQFRIWSSLAVNTSVHLCAIRQS